MCAIYLSLKALQHCAKPKIDVKLVSENELTCDKQATIALEISNHGHWYAKPVARDVKIYCNFAPEFELEEIRYGSTQSERNSDVRVGKGGLKYLVAQGIVVAYGEPGEQVHVVTKAPREAGNYVIRVVAVAENGGEFVKEFTVKCVVKDERPVMNGSRSELVVD